MMLLVIQRLIIEFLFDIVYAPVWWYTIGIQRAGFFCIRLIREGNAQFAPGLWLANIFVPMFGQYDWQGRLVSFFVRLGNVIIRTILVCIWVIFSCVVFLLWLVIPLAILYMLVLSFR